MLDAVAAENRNVAAQQRRERDLRADRRRAVTEYGQLMSGEGAVDEEEDQDDAMVPHPVPAITVLEPTNNVNAPQRWLNDSMTFDQLCERLQQQK